ncbi:MAG: LysM peptidoglycan-binding domain-containing protein [Cyanobacteria bacterium SBC]|nr:LysM peptidoglycan-binding domain-containing protein [Cyanobacteria bacterium SBC]
MTEFRTYRTKRGDRLDAIAFDAGTTTAALAQLNRLALADHRGQFPVVLNEGIELVVPVAIPTAVASVPWKVRS